MTGLPRQLTLDWPHRPSFAAEDFLAAPANREALAAVARWPDWASRMLLLLGPEGSGKSHLGHLWAERAGATVVHGETLADADVAACADAAAILIEDADRIGAREDRLFHILNAVLQNQSFALLTARTEPSAWALRTPDLLSRLRLAPLVGLGAPDFDLTEAVLFKLFSDRQLTVEPRVVAFIALRIERSLAAARRIVAALDHEALARGRRVTRAMAAEVLREAGSSEEGP
ncbi:DnaA protein [Roseiarcus fermentans]|uniref:DnaA protein n=1 Tax=Roseiarcus fermentans TaxID=1473586 RepID=A0A366FP33_9HYPH|nr:DnaA/Hda family protein [Roseiarcus fermentans]RBP15820.1 DnaA protein [Roseiarcus fermentans]